MNTMAKIAAILGILNLIAFMATLVLAVTIGCLT